MEEEGYEPPVGKGLGQKLKMMIWYSNCTTQGSEASYIPSNTLYIYLFYSCYNIVIYFLNRVSWNKTLTKKVFKMIDDRNYCTQV